MSERKPMTFEEWYEEYNFDERLLNIDKFEDCWTAAQFALNSELGIAANEAAKDARRKVAMNGVVDQLEYFVVHTDEKLFYERVDAIIKAAQG